MACDGRRGGVVAKPGVLVVKFGAVVLVANDWRFVPAVVGQLLKVVDRCLILRSTVAFSGATLVLTPAPVLDRRVSVIIGNWPTEQDTRNAGMEMLTIATTSSSSTLTRSCWSAIFVFSSRR